MTTIKRNYSIMEYFDRIADGCEPSLRFSGNSTEQFALWRDRLHNKLLELLGEFPEKCPLKSEVIEKVIFDGYVREKVVFNSEAHASVPAYVLYPIPTLSGMRHKTILCCHGHGNGKDDVVGITDKPDLNPKSSRAKTIEQHNYDYAVQLVRCGYLTIAPDWRCFGERLEVPENCSGKDTCDLHFIRGSLLGINLLALHVWDAIRTIDYLVTRSDVDRNRIGCMGLSFGGTMTTWLTALDERVKVAVISGYLCSFKGFAINKGMFCGSQLVHGLLRYADIPDIASLIAPRPLLIESGIRDSIFPIEQARDAYRVVQKVYKCLDSTERLDMDEFEGGHEFSGRKAFAWFDKWL